jgi:hypothetical protein
MGGEQDICVRIDWQGKNQHQDCKFPVLIILLYVHLSSLFSRIRVRPEHAGDAAVVRHYAFVHVGSTVVHQRAEHGTTYIIQVYAHLKCFPLKLSTDHIDHLLSTLLCGTTAYWWNYVQTYSLSTSVTSWSISLSTRSRLHKPYILFHSMVLGWQSKPRRNRTRIMR